MAIVLVWKFTLFLTILHGFRLNIVSLSLVNITFLFRLIFCMGTSISVDRSSVFSVLTAFFFNSVRRVLPDSILAVSLS